MSKTAKCKIELLGLFLTRNNGLGSTKYTQMLLGFSCRDGYLVNYQILNNLIPI